MNLAAFKQPEKYIFNGLRTHDRNQLVFLFIPQLTSTNQGVKLSHIQDANPGSYIYKYLLITYQMAFIFVYRTVN